MSPNTVGCTRCTPWVSLYAQAARTAPRPTVSQSCHGPCCSMWSVVSQVRRPYGHAPRGRAPARYVARAVPCTPCPMSLSALPRPCAPCRGLAGRVAGCIVTQPSGQPLANLSQYSQLYGDTPTPGCLFVTIQ